MTVENRLTSKRISKTEAVTSLVPYNLPTRIGPSDYVPFLKNKKICYLSIKTRAFGDRPINISAKLEVEDSPNSAGVVIDLIRAAKIALDRKIAGTLISMPSYAFKHPPVQVPDLAGEAVDRGLDSGQTRTLNPPPSERHLRPSQQHPQTDNNAGLFIEHLACCCTVCFNNASHAKP